MLIISCKLSRTSITNATFQPLTILCAKPAWALIIKYTKRGVSSTCTAPFESQSLALINYTKRGGQSYMYSPIWVTKLGMERPLQAQYYTCTLKPYRKIAVSAFGTKTNTHPSRKWTSITWINTGLLATTSRGHHKQTVGTKAPDISHHLAFLTTYHRPQVTHYRMNTTQFQWTLNPIHPIGNSVKKQKLCTKV